MTILQTITPVDARSRPVRGVWRCLPPKAHGRTHLRRPFGLPISLRAKGWGSPAPTSILATSTRRLMSRRDRTSRDSLGTLVTIRPGQYNSMTAGSKYRPFRAQPGKRKGDRLLLRHADLVFYPSRMVGRK